MINWQYNILHNVFITLKILFNLFYFYWMLLNNEAIAYQIFYRYPPPGSVCLCFQIKINIIQNYCKPGKLIEKMIYSMYYPPTINILIYSEEWSDHRHYTSSIMSMDGISLLYIYVNNFSILFIFHINSKGGENVIS